MTFYYHFLNNFTILIPELYLFILINILLLYGIIYNILKYNNYPNLINNIGWLLIQTLIITFFLIFNNKITFSLIINNLLIHTQFTIFFKIFIVILSILCFFILNYLIYNNIKVLFLNIYDIINFKFLKI